MYTMDPLLCTLLGSVGCSVDVKAIVVVVARACQLLRYVACCVYVLLHSLSLYINSACWRVYCGIMSAFVGVLLLCIGLYAQQLKGHLIAS